MIIDLNYRYFYHEIWKLLKILIVNLMIYLMLFLDTEVASHAFSMRPKKARTKKLVLDVKH